MARHNRFFNDCEHEVTPVSYSTLQMSTAIHLTFTIPVGVGPFLQLQPAYDTLQCMRWHC